MCGDEVDARRIIVQGTASVDFTLNAAMSETGAVAPLVFCIGMFSLRFYQEFHSFEILRESTLFRQRLPISLQYMFAAIQDLSCRMLVALL